MKRSALALFLSAIFLAGCSHPQPVYMAPPPPALSPSSVFQQGTHDGFEAARRDVAEGRPPIFDHHPRFRLLVIIVKDFVRATTSSCTRVGHRRRQPTRCPELSCEDLAGRLEAEWREYSTPPLAI